MRDFSPHFRTLVYDCRGQGQSDKPHEGPYTSELHARDLAAALLDALKIERAHFVGLSNGGLVLMHFSKLFPKRLDRIVFVDTFSHMNAVQQAMLKSWRAALETGGSALRFLVSLPWTWSADFLEGNYQAIMALQAQAAQLPTHSSIHLVDGAMTHDARPWLGEIKALTLIVHGDQDRMAPLYHLHTLHQSIPHETREGLAARTGNQQVCRAPKTSRCHTDADLVVAAVLVPGARAPRVITEEMFPPVHRGHSATLA